MGLPGVQQLGTATYKRVAASRTCTTLDRTEARGENLLSASAPPIARAVPLAGLGLMVILGLLHVDNAWPLSCFPPFDAHTSNTVTRLSIQILDAGTAEQDWSLSSDLKLRTVYRSWHWLARQGTAAGPATRPKVAALGDLWLKA